MTNVAATSGFLKCLLLALVMSSGVACECLFQHSVEVFQTVSTEHIIDLGQVRPANV